MAQRASPQRAPTHAAQLVLPKLRFVSRTRQTIRYPTH
jgi:hypothetical protein